MPGYAISDDETGLLSWSWAEERLVRSHDYWLATTRPDGRPHLMPVWAIWHEGALWFSTAPSSRKALDLADDARCSIATDDAYEPVVVEGVAERVDDGASNAWFCEATNAKYDTDYEPGFFAANATFRVRPDRAFGLDEAAFPTSPTRWVFS